MALRVSQAARWGGKDTADVAKVPEAWQRGSLHSSSSYRCSSAKEFVHDFVNHLVKKMMHLKCAETSFCQTNYANLRSRWSIQW